MRQSPKIIAPLLMALFATAVVAVGQVPGLVNYQGRLTGPGGEPLDTTVSMTFSIYADSTGGDPLWSETHESVVVSNGLFNVVLGSVGPKNRESYPFDVTISDGETFIDISIGEDPSLEPRTRLMTMPYSIVSHAINGHIKTAQDHILVGDSAESFFDVYAHPENGTGIKSSFQNVAGDNTDFELLCKPDTMGFRFESYADRGVIHLTYLDYWIDYALGSSFKMSDKGTAGEGVVGFTAGGEPAGYNGVSLKGEYRADAGDSSVFALEADAGGARLMVTDNVGDTAVSIDGGDGSIRTVGKVSAGAFTSNSPLIFEAPVGTERARIDDITGYFGINTTTPGARLEVYGATDATTPLLKLNHLPTSPTGILDDVFEINEAYFGYKAFTINGGGLMTQYDGPGSIANFINPVGDSYFNALNARVGIGTSSPNTNYSLHVEGRDRGTYSIATQGTYTVRPYGIYAGLNTTSMVATGGGLLVNINKENHAPNITFVMGGDFTLTRGSATGTNIGVRVLLEGEQSGDYGIQLDVSAPAHAIYSHEDGPSYFEGNIGAGISNPARKLHVNDVMRLEPRSSAPSNPSEGDIYYNGTAHTLMVYNGTTWMPCF